MSSAADLILRERRTLLPGVLTLFGFQFVTVFTSGFQEGLDRTEQRVHLVAITLVALAIATLATPTAYLQRTDLPEATPKVIHTERSLMTAMLALAIAIPLELFLVACVILLGQVAIALGVAALGLFFIAWFVLPLARRLR